MDSQSLAKTELVDGTIMFGYKNEYVFNVISTRKDFYELIELRRFFKYVNENSVIYDIGANIGNHSIYFKKYFKAKKIYSFEPAPLNSDLLERNIRENKITEIEVFKVALGDKSTKAGLLLNEKNMGECKLVESKDATIEVPVECIDNMNLEFPDFVKIDVEGNELNVLIGMSKILSSASPILWIEINKEQFQNVDHFLMNHDYYLVEKFQFNHIYVKCESLEERLKNYEIFKESAVAEYNNAVVDKWNLNKWLTSEKEKVKKLENEVGKQIEIREELNTKLLTHMEKIIEIKEEKQQYKIENDIFKKELNEHKLQLSDLKKEIEKEKQDIYIKVLHHVKMEKEALLELKALRDHYQLMEARYMRLRHSLPGKIGVKVWKLYKRLKEGTKA